MKIFQLFIKLLVIYLLYITVCRTRNCAA